MSRARSQLTLVPLTYRNVVPALGLARKSFGPEFPLVVGTYAWHFYRQARLPDPGFMARRSTASLLARGPTRTITFVTTVIHGDDICWVDDVQGDWGEELRSFAESWRVCLFRSNRPDPPANGTILRGTMPSNDGQSTYVFSLPRRATENRKPASRVLERRRLKTSADFFTLSRAGRTVGITGLYDAEYWPGIAWGAWGTLAREIAHRDAVFEAIRLTEELAQERGADWFCIETSSDPRYASARAMYQHYGLRLLLSVPEFFKSADGQDSDYLVYGRRVGR